MESLLNTSRTNENGPQFMANALAVLNRGIEKRDVAILGLREHCQASTLFIGGTESAHHVLVHAIHTQYPACQVVTHADGSRGGPAIWTAHVHLLRGLLPIKRFTQFELSIDGGFADPIAAAFAAVRTPLRGGLHARIEIAIRNVRHRRRHRMEKVLRKLVTPFFQHHHRLAHHYLCLALSPTVVVRILGWLLGCFAGQRNGGERQLNVSPGSRHERESDLQAASDKLNRPLFETSISIIVEGPKESRLKAHEKIKEIAATFGQFSQSRLAAFELGPIRRGHRRIKWSKAGALSAEELATIWHPPFSSVRVPGIAAVESREFEPPLNLPLTKAGPDLAVLGVTCFRTQKQRFGILQEDRFRHGLLIGKTGQGKSSLLQQLVHADILAGRSLTLLDPHGDVAAFTLATVPGRRTNDVVYFDAGDASNPLAFNPLECTKPTDRPLVVSGVVSALRKIFGQMWGPRMEYILRQALLAILEGRDASFLTVLRFLSEPSYRKEVLRQVRDPVVLQYWMHEFAAMPTRLSAPSSLIVALLWLRIASVVSDRFYSGKAELGAAAWGAAVRTFASAARMERAKGRGVARGAPLATPKLVGDVDFRQVPFTNVKVPVG